MGVSGISANFMGSLSDFSTADLLHVTKAQDLAGEESLAAMTDSPARTAQNASSASQQSGSLTTSLQDYSGQSESMMAQNFVSASEEPSRYITARFDSFSTAMKMKQAEKSSVTSLLDEFGGIAGPSFYDPNGNSKSGGESEATIRQRLMQRAGKEIVDKAAEDFKKAREQQEEQADETAASQDENGTAGADSTDPGTTSTPLAERAASSASDVTATSDTVPVPDLSVVGVTASDGASAAATASASGADATASAAPAAPQVSIDMYV